MNTIARIYMDGTLSISGSILEMSPSWENNQELSTSREIDDGIEIQDSMMSEDFMYVLFGMSSHLQNYSELKFDTKGNIYTHQVEEVEQESGFVVLDDFRVRVRSIKEGVSFE